MADGIDQLMMDNSAVYASTIGRLRTNSPNMPEAEMHAIALAAIDTSVHGHDCKKDSRGRFIPQGIGSPSNLGGNHFAAIRKYEGKEAWETAIRAAWKADPEQAKRLHLPELTK